MKRILIMSVILAAAVQSYAQGQFNFKISTANGRLIYTDIVGGTVANASYKIDYYFSTTPNVTDPNLLIDGNKIVTLGVSGTTLGSTQTFGGTGGTVNGLVTLPTYVGTISLEVRAWLAADGATWAAAKVLPGGHVGQSGVFNVVLGDPTAQPPGTPADITGLMPSFVVSSVPEPSTIALGIMGLSALMIRRRK